MTVLVLISLTYVVNRAVKAEADMLEGLTWLIQGE